MTRNLIQFGYSVVMAIVSLLLLYIIQPPFSGNGWFVIILIPLFSGYITYALGMGEAYLRLISLALSGVFVFILFLFSDGDPASGSYISVLGFGLGVSFMAGGVLAWFISVIYQIMTSNKTLQSTAKDAGD